MKARLLRRIFEAIEDTNEAEVFIRQVDKYYAVLEINTTDGNIQIGTIDLELMEPKENNL